MLVDIVHSYQTIPHTPAAEVAAGDVVAQGALLGVAATILPADEPGALVVAGVVEVPKAAEAFSAGDVVYWDAADSEVNSSATGNTQFGRVIADAASGDSHCRILIRGA